MNPKDDEFTINWEDLKFLIQYANAGITSAGEYDQNSEHFRNLKAKINEIRCSCCDKIVQESGVCCPWDESHEADVFICYKCLSWITKKKIIYISEAVKKWRKL